MARELVHEDDEQKVYLDVGDRWTSTQVEWKAGHEPGPDRLTSLEQRVDAASALAEQANATAQDVAKAMKPSR